MTTLVFQQNRYCYFHFLLGGGLSRRRRDRIYSLNIREAVLCVLRTFLISYFWPKCGRSSQPLGFEPESRWDSETSALRIFNALAGMQAKLGHLQNPLNSGAFWGLIA